MTDISTPRLPTEVEVRKAQDFLRKTAGHSCYVCSSGCADCGTINERGEAHDVVSAHELKRPISPCSAWPMMDDEE